MQSECIGCINFRGKDIGGDRHYYCLVYRDINQPIVLDQDDGWCHTFGKPVEEEYIE